VLQHHNTQNTKREDKSIMKIRLIGYTLVLAATAALNAQISTKITGSVVDSSGAAIPDASVKVALPGTTAAAYTTTTSTTGSFILASISPATYDLVIEKGGFAQTVVKGVVVDPDRTTDVPPVRMKIASTSETVEVKADQESVNTSNDEVSQTIGKTQMQNLPVADRRPLGFLQTQAGINNAAGSTAVNGQRSSYVNVTVDGINVQDNFIRTNDVDFLPNLLREAFFRCRCDQLPVLKQGRGTIVIIAGDSENGGQQPAPASFAVASAIGAGAV
jgi:hypothetical protein